jgi:beta-glucosidase
MSHIADLSLEERATLTGGAALWASAALPDAGVEAVTMADGPMGVASGRVDERDVSVLTPCGTAVAASWDEAVARRLGALVGEEARRCGVKLVLAPNLNLPRSPLAGRAFETLSEDPLLSGALGAAWVEGMQGRGVGACLKHAAGNDSETRRDIMNAVIDPRALREVYLLPFEMAAQGGAWAVMAAYNRLNGFYCAESAELLSEIIKGDWSFDGALLSDWFGVSNGLASARAGLDLEMPGPARHMGRHLLEHVRSGVLPQARIDDAAERVIRLSQRVNAAPPATAGEAAEPLLLEAAAEGFTLLKNAGELLPLDPRSGGKIAVIGPNAFNPCYQGGTFAKIAVRPDAKTPKTAIAERFGGCDIAFAPGVDPQPRLPSMPARPIRELGDGDRGMTVDYFAGHDFDAAPLFSETRDTNTLTWFSMPGGASPHVAGGVRAAGMFTPESDGEHVFYAGATGPVRLTVDGREIYRSDLQPPAADLMGVLKAGEAEGTPLLLKAGQPVRVEVELRYAPFRAQGLWYGIRPPGDSTTMLAEAEALAREAAAVVLVVGETSDNSVESRDRQTTLLDPGQRELIARVCAANPNTAVVVNAGHAVDLSFADQARAVMMTWLPGEMFGPALAAVLAGDLEPGGRLPVTLAARDEDYPAMDLTPDADNDVVYAEGWRIGYRSFQARGVAPRFALGEGEGYTRFELKGSSADRTPDGGIELVVELRNVGARAGKAVVQAYLDGPGDDAPVACLAGWAVARLPAGEAGSARIQVRPRSLQHWDVESGTWRTAGGVRRLRIGFSSRDLPLVHEIEVA